MNFTREPIIETIITPKEGCKLVVRNSKGSGHEEYLVDALEVVSFGQALFFRSLERPKSFLVPVSDYELLEIREARMVLKVPTVEKGIKIGGGKEPSTRAIKESISEKLFEEAIVDDAEDESLSIVGTDASSADGRDKKKDRRRNRRRRGRTEEKDEGTSSQSAEDLPVGSHSKEAPHENVRISAGFSMLLPPPSMLISESIAKYRGNAEYKMAFFDEQEEKESEESVAETDLFGVVGPDSPEEQELGEFPFMLDLPRRERAHLDEEHSDELHSTNDD